MILVGVALLQWTVQSSSSCKGTDGRPGEAGLAGRDGWPGLKGEKGQPAQLDKVGNLPPVKGARGSRGSQGALGPKGYQGDIGEEGEMGPPGAQGPQAGNYNPAATIIHRSAFSVVRTLNTYPPVNMKVVFQNTITNTPGDFDLATGTFTCRVPGVYYFVFHAYSKVSMCLRLRSQVVSDSTLGFCDYNGRRTGQVLTGGVVLQLNQGQHVWMESFMDRQGHVVTADTQEKQIIFNGFLLFPTS